MSKSAKPSLAGREDLISISPDALDKIATAGRQLQRASAILACLAAAADNDAEFDAADVASAVRAMVDSSVDALDSMRLRVK